MSRRVIVLPAKCLVLLGDFVGSAGPAHHDDGLERIGSVQQGRVQHRRVTPGIRLGFAAQVLFLLLLVDGGEPEHLAAPRRTTALVTPSALDDVVLVRHKPLALFCLGLFAVLRDRHGIVPVALAVAGRLSSEDWQLLTGSLRLLSFIVTATAVPPLL